jgi:hypothetical protein
MDEACGVIEIVDLALDRDRLLAEEIGVAMMEHTRANCDAPNPLDPKLSQMMVQMLVHQGRPLLRR